jgi:hypothetical protein
VRGASGPLYRAAQPAATGSCAVTDNGYRAFMDMEFATGRGGTAWNGDDQMVAVKPPHHQHSTDRGVETGPTLR